MHAGSECRNFPVSCMCGVQDVINIWINVMLIIVHLLKKLLSCKSTEPPYPGAKLLQRGTSANRAINRNKQMHRHEYKTLELRSAYPIFNLYGFFFQSEKYFSFTIIQPEQCFQPVSTKKSVSRTGPSIKVPY